MPRETPQQRPSSRDRAKSPGRRQASCCPAAAELLSVGDREALAVLMKDIRPLYKAGADHRGAARRGTQRRVALRSEPPSIAAVSYVQNKATEEVHDRLVGLLKFPICAPSTAST